VTVLPGWIAVRGTALGPLFTSVRHGTTGEPICGNAVARLLRRRAHAAGLVNLRITGHDVRPEQALLTTFSRWLGF
jgi:integrase